MMLHFAGLLNMFWAEAVNMAAYVYNQMPTDAIKEEKLQWKDGVEKSQTWDISKCLDVVHTHIPDLERRKLDNKAEKLIFVGYSKEPKLTNY